MVPESFPGIFFHQQLHDLAALLVALRLSLALDTLCVRRSQLSFLDLSSVVEGPFCLPSPRDHAGKYNLEHLIILWYSVSRRRVIYWKGSVIRFVLRPEGTLDHSTMRRIATKTTVTHPCGSYFALVIIVSFLPCSLSAVRRLWLISIFSSSVIWLQSLSRVFTPSLRNCSSFLLSL